MSNFVPGKIVREISTKKGRVAQLIYPKWELVDQAQQYINALSTEDTYVSFSGEQMTLKEEAQFLAEVFVQMELRQACYLFCVVDGKLAGICGIEQLPALRQRGKHVGTFGLSIGKEYRGEGLGYELAHQAILEATQYVIGLQMVVLQCFANNAPAQALYKKLGFVETGRVPKMFHWHDQYIDEVQMALPVTSDGIASPGL